MRLESWYVPAVGGGGSLRLRLVNTGHRPVSEFELTLTSIVPLDPSPLACLVRRRSGCHVIAPPAGTVIEPGGTWELTATCGHRLRHANDGPESAFLTLSDGAVVDVRTAQTRRVAVGVAAPLTYRPDGELAATALAEVAARDRRLHPECPPVLSPTGATVVRAALVDGLETDAFQLHVEDDEWLVTAGSTGAVERALTMLARGARSGAQVPVGAQAPRYGWRGLHVDLARQFLPAVDVDWLIDVAAWHGLNRLHVHLTDDEGWRFPVEGYPALTEVASWRGAGLPVPPLLGSGPAPYGGSYSRHDIARWHERAGAAGVVIVPEVDLPGHCFAALAAVPELVDRDDTSGAVSVQHFVDNVLNPGVDATWPFLEAVLGTLADAFPGPWLHLGGDEVATGAWSGSPAAQRWAAARGLSGSDEIATAFVCQLVTHVRSVHGRAVGVWEEAAGALEPGDGYVLGWRSAAVCRELAAAGHEVVAAPAESVYLDMAASADWYEPGMSWAGHTSVAEVEAFDPAAGWSPAERANLLGVQACTWAEHLHDRPALERMLFARLTAFADAAWSLRPASPGFS